LTHPAAALAFNDGEANDVARLVAGAAVAVAPMLIAVGSNAIVGTVGETYDPVVDESPDPPATLRGLEAPGCEATIAAAAMTALMPSAVESDVSRCVRIAYLQQMSVCRSVQRTDQSNGGLSKSTRSHLAGRRSHSQRSSSEPHLKSQMEVTGVYIMRRIIGS
jgi:hypothetical protein